MRKRTKLTLALTSATLPVLLAAAPAGADSSAVGQKDFTFTYQGTSVTCTLYGDSSAQYTGGDVDRTVIKAFTWVDGADPHCQDPAVIQEVGASVDYLRAGESRGDTASGGARGLHEELDLDVPGQISALRSSHGVAYACDEEQGGLCGTTLSLHTK